MIIERIRAAGGDIADVAIITLVTKPHLQRRDAGQLVHIDKFEAWLDGELIVTSKQPRLDAARELLRRGYLPDELMTTRAHDRGYDSFVPAPIGELAKWTIVEEDKRGLRRRFWQPHPNAVSRGSVDGRTGRSSGFGRNVHTPREAGRSRRGGERAPGGSPQFQPIAMEVRQTLEI